MNLQLFFLSSISIFKGGLLSLGALVVQYLGQSPQPVGVSLHVESCCLFSPASSCFLCTPVRSSGTWPSYAAVWFCFFGCVWIQLLLWPGQACCVLSIARQSRRGCSLFWPLYGCPPPRPTPPLPFLEHQRESMVQTGPLPPRKGGVMTLVMNNLNARETTEINNWGWLSRSR